MELISKMICHLELVPQVRYPPSPRAQSRGLFFFVIATSEASLPGACTQGARAQGATCLLHTK